MGQAQVIKCVCGSIFAGCVVPECYTEVEWQRDMRKYVKKGCTVELKENGRWKFEICICNKKGEKDLKQLQIF